jgi:putative membrane protein insertion efficiency factor
LLQSGIQRHAYILRLMKRLLILLIDAYRLLLSPFFGTQCRFWPTCSAYAREAIDTHGAIKGTWLTVRRLGKCHPWHEGGIDNVPPATAEKR